MEEPAFELKMVLLQGSVFLNYPMLPLSFNFAFVNLDSVCVSHTRLASRGQALDLFPLTVVSPGPATRSGTQKALNKYLLNGSRRKVKATVNCQSRDSHTDPSSCGAHTLPSHVLGHKGLPAGDA